MTEPIRPPGLSTEMDSTGESFTPLCTTTVTVTEEVSTEGKLAE